MARPNPWTFGIAAASATALALVLASVLAIALAPGAIAAAPLAVDSAPTMLPVPAGSYLMGDAAGDGGAEERPAHAVRIRAFRIARTETTRGEFARFVAATGYRTEAERDVIEPGCWVQDAARPDGGAYTAGTSWRGPGLAQGDDHPVVCVSWNDAQAYVRWLARTTGRRFRLPSNAEWEYAARAGTTTRYPWGDDADAACRHANGTRAAGAGAAGPGGDCDDGWLHTAPVASYAPNAWGLHDMIGNAWEWTADCDRDDYARSPRDGRADTGGDCSRRIDRGGSWFTDAGWLRSSARDRDEPTNRFSHLGFRVAEDAGPG